MASYIGQTALTALWNKLVAILSSKADRSSVYSKAEVDYKLATTYGTGSGSGGGDTSDCVLLTGNQTITGAKTFVDQGLLVRSSNTSYSATIRNSASGSRTIYLPSASGTHYIVSRTGSVTGNNIPQWDGTTGVLKSGYAVNTSITSSSTGIPTSAAVRSYVSSNSGGGGDVWYTIRPSSSKSSYNYGVTIDCYNDNTPSSSIVFFWMTWHKAGNDSRKRSWHIPYLGYLRGAAQSGYKPLAYCKWNVSGAYTPLWGGTYTAQQIYANVNAHGHPNGPKAIFAAALFLPGTVTSCTRVSNLAVFKLMWDGTLRFSSCHNR